MGVSWLDVAWLPAPLALALVAGLVVVGMHRGGQSMKPAALSLGPSGPYPDDTSFAIAVIDPCPRGVPPAPGLQPEQVEIDVVETTDAVIVTARAPVPRQGACNARSDAVPVTIELTEPFGDRVLLDGQFDPPRSPTRDVYSRNPTPPPPTTESPFGDLLPPDHIKEK